MKLFADDAKFYRSVTNQEHVEQVQYNVNEAVTLTNIWEMLFNFKKCKHLHIGSRTDPATYTMNTGHETIEIEKVTSEKDLGVIIDQSLNFSKHINEKVNKANRNLGIIFRTSLTWTMTCSATSIKPLSDHTWNTQQLSALHCSRRICSLFQITL